MEKKKESLKSQLQESQVNERLAEQKLSTVKEQLDETRARMVSRPTIYTVICLFVQLW